MVHLSLLARSRSKLGGACQSRPGRQRVHIVPPMDDLSVLDGDDRYEPVVVGNATRKDCAVHLVFENCDATTLGMVYNKSVGGVQPDVVAIPRELSHQVSSASNRWRPPRNAIAKLKKRVLCNRVEIV